MLENRDYGRQPEFRESRRRSGFGLRWSWTLALVAAYVAVLLAQKLTEAVSPREMFTFDSYFALSTEGLAHGYVWQLLTYQFMHAGYLHLILNCWAIIVFGSEVERILGARRFLLLTFSSGIVGGVFQVLTAIAWPSLFGHSAVVGASACAFGLVAAFALLLPHQELTMLVLFVIPVRMRARTLLMLCVVIALMGIIFPMDNIANAAHLGGIAMGWFYVRKILKIQATPAGVVGPAA